MISTMTSPLAPYRKKPSKKILPLQMAAGQPSHGCRMTAGFGPGGQTLYPCGSSRQGKKSGLVIATVASRYGTVGVPAGYRRGTGGEPLWYRCGTVDDKFLTASTGNTPCSRQSLRMHLQFFDFVTISRRNQQYPEQPVEAQQAAYLVNRNQRPEPPGFTETQ